MDISILDIFSIGIGPSSSHTVGPMRAANAFLKTFLSTHETFDSISRMQVDLYGSLALTGKGHKTDTAIMLGLLGELPETIDSETIAKKTATIINEKSLLLGGKTKISFDVDTDIVFHCDKFLSKHSNGLSFIAFDNHHQKLLEETYFSVGGGFIINNNEATHLADDLIETSLLPYPFKTAKELLELCHTNNLTIAELMLENEKHWRGEDETKQKILQFSKVMKESIQRGYHQSGVLPGGLNVRRRAPDLYAQLDHNAEEVKENYMQWLNLYAISVNEENAAGGRIVTAPTNGAAGVIPATLEYYKKFVSNADENGIIIFLATAAAIGILFKKGASLSAAEVGCQGEVGVACSMAAAGLTAVLGGTLAQIENAAEMGMEHNLGLTCDPINGLVQIPCIERNAMGAVQAVNCATLALLEDGEHYVSLDKVIATMLRTGKDMQSIYKETSLGGLAVNVPEC